MKVSFASDSGKIIMRVLVAILLMAAFLQPFFSGRQFSPAGDEITHLPSGYSYLKTGRIELNPQHPPLVKILAALPLLLLKPNFSSDDLELGEWRFGSRFLFGNNTDLILLGGRLAPILISVLLAFFVFKWTTEMLGPLAGLLALAFYTFIPNVLGHAQFVTTDLPAAAFVFIAVYWLWRYFCQPKRSFLFWGGLFSGLALSSKFSGVIVLPVIAILAAVFLLLQKRGPELIPKEKLITLIRITSVIFGLALMITWAIYFFPKDPLFYLKGYQTVYADRNPNFHFYLNGDFNQDGWWYYFLWAFLIKTPIPFLILTGLAVWKWRWIFSMGNKLPGWLNALFIFLPAGLWLLASSWQAANIGVRYILTIYPFLAVAAGGSAVALIKEIKWNKIMAPILAVLVIWQIASTLVIFPDFLAYFNELAGGAKDGYRFLDDSNLSWGQDLKRLAIYQKEHPGTKVIYHWQNSQPGFYGITDYSSEAKIVDWQKPLGRWAVDINYLIRAKFVSQKKNDPSFDWLNLYQPVARVGYSFLVYEF